MPKLFSRKKKLLIPFGVQLTPAVFQVLAMISGEAAEAGAQNPVGHILFLRGHWEASHTKPLNCSVPSSHTGVTFTRLCKAR